MRLKRYHKYKYAKLFRLVKIETSNYHPIIIRYPFQRIQQSVNFNLLLLNNAPNYSLRTRTVAEAGEEQNVIR